MGILFNFGPVKVYTLSLFLVLAFFWAGFVVSKKGVEYHLKETAVYDALVVALLVSGVIAKGLSWLEMAEFSQIGVWIGMVGAGLFLARKEEVKLFTVLDIFSLGLIMALSWWGIGRYWSGSLAGKMIGEWVVPVELVAAGLFLLAFVCLWRLEQNYRTLSWYRGRRSVANTGFIFGLALGIYGVVGLIETWLSDVVKNWQWVSGGIFIILGLMIVYWRSGRNLRSDLRPIMAKFKRN